jgi:hypothetical protein
MPGVEVAVGSASVGGRDITVGTITGAVAMGAGDAQPASNKMINRDFIKYGMFFSLEKQYFYD